METPQIYERTILGIQNGSVKQTSNGNYHATVLYQTANGFSKASLFFPKELPLKVGAGFDLVPTTPEVISELLEGRSIFVVDLPVPTGTDGSYNVTDKETGEVLSFRRFASLSKPVLENNITKVMQEQNA